MGIDYQAKMVLDSVNAVTGSRLSTIHMTMPWALTPELLRHRCFSFSSRSTRAVPTGVLLDQYEYDPCITTQIGKNKKGMQATEDVGEIERLQALSIIHKIIDLTSPLVRQLADLKVHKQVANKYMIPGLWCDILVSSTTWANFLALRTDEGADPGLQILGGLVADALVESKPRSRLKWQVHLPYIDEEDIAFAWDYVPKDESIGDYLKMWSAARIARVSVKPFDSNKKDYDRDTALAKDLAESRPVHISPFEHIATALEGSQGTGNFGQASGWRQARYMMDQETFREFHWKGKVIV